MIFSETCDFGRPTATVEHVKSGNGAHIRFPNGWLVSVQWGPYTYSTNHRYEVGVVLDAPALEATTAEIAAWKNDGDMVRWPDGDTVQGWQSWDDVQAVLDRAERDELPIEEGGD